MVRRMSTLAIFAFQIGIPAAFVASAWAAYAAAQNPLAALANEAKEKAAETALTKVLNDNLPLTLDAKDVYPTVTTLPGGPFNPKPLQLTADQLDQPLPPGDYTINTLDFCSEYSVHQPGAGTAYVLGPYEGKAAGAIGALIWRGTEQYNIASGNLQAVSWAIQSGLTYDQMPKSYQAIIDQVIPDQKSEITGDFVTNLENTYNDLAKAASLPPLDTILAKLGEPGQLALDAERQRQILTAQNTSDELKQQTLFQGQESGIYTPVSAESGPWTERVAGQVYMKLLIAGGNMATNNVMEIRVMPSPTANAQLQSGGPRLVRAGYGEGQVTPAMDNAPITITTIMQGILGYSMGKGAQALGQVAQLLKALEKLNPLGVTPAEAAGPETPPKAPVNAPAPPATVATGAPPDTNPASPPAPQGAAPSGAAQAASTNQKNFRFASCSGDITSNQLYSAYSNLYSSSSTFKNEMDLIKNQVFVLVVDGLNSDLGKSYQTKATNAYCYIANHHPCSGLGVPPSGDFAFTYIPSAQNGGDIRVVISAQNLLYNVYDHKSDTAMVGTPVACGVTDNRTIENMSIQRLLAYELGQNAKGLSGSAQFPEQPDETDTNGIMDDLGEPTDNIPDQGQACAIMSGTAYCSDARICALGSVTNCENKSCAVKIIPGASSEEEASQARASKIQSGIFDIRQGFLHMGADPPFADIFDGTGQPVGQYKCTDLGNQNTDKTMPDCAQFKVPKCPQTH
jgi:hypothetical protein